MPPISVGFGRPLAIGLGEVRQPLYHFPFVPILGATAATVPSFTASAASNPDRLWHLSRNLRGKPNSSVAGDFVERWLAEQEQPKESDPTSTSALSLAALEIDINELVEATKTENASPKSAPGPPSECASESADQVASSEPEPVRVSPGKDVPRKEIEPKTTLGVYSQHIRQLEQRCQELFSDNVLLRTIVRAADAGQKNIRELNIRLGKEVQDSRKRAADAEQRVASLADELAQVKAELQSSHKAQSRAPSVSTAADLDSRTDTELSEVSTPPGLTSPNEVEQPPGLELRWPVCSCGTDQAWGCDRHNVYGSSLMLAHRDKSLSIARGAPGLEAPADLESPAANLAKTVSCAVAQASAWHPVVRRSRVKAQ